MTDKLIALEVLDNAKHISLWGDYNDVPTGFKEITELEFARSSFFSYCITKVESRQMRIADDQPLLDVRLFYMNDNTQFAMGHNSRTGKVTYYRFGCEHEYVETNNYAKCLHNYKCKKCGYETEIDSSD